MKKMLHKIGGRFSLEDIKEDHLSFLYNFRLSGVRKWFFDDRAITWSQHLTWYENYVKNNDRLFAIYDHACSIYIGTVGFLDYQKEQRIIEFGRFGINNKNYLGKGYGTLISQSLFDHVLMSSKIEAIVLDVIAENKIVGLYVKLGFVVNGFEENYECYPGRTINKVSMILTKEKFYEDNRN
jgi:RimJ/RimL family protein N-acetyltransferase